MKNKTYYDWLEVSPKASPEVIEKAYKALVLKYHPDLQQSNSKNSEEILQKINEAYSILSDKTKRQEYDSMLFAKRQQIRKQYEPSQNKKQQEKTHQYNDDEIQQEKLEAEYMRQVESARRQAYRDAYIQDMKNRGYKIRYKKSLKDYIRIIVTILVIFIVIWIFWHIPFIHNWITNLAEDNFVIQLIVDIIRSVYEALFETFF